MKPLLLIPVVLIAAALHMQSAQAQYIVTHPPIISINTDELITQARKFAIAEGKPELEFEMFKQLLKRRVDSSRATDSQQVSFATPGSFRSWLRTISSRSGKPYEQLAWELVEAVSPNACPDLEEHRDSADYIRSQRLQSSPPGNPVGAPNSSAPHTPAPPGYSPDKRMEADDAPIVTRSSATRSTDQKTTISIEFVPSPGNPQKR